jgi:hypothetical protein
MKKKNKETEEVKGQWVCGEKLRFFVSEEKLDGAKEQILELERRLAENKEKNLH